MRYFEKISKKAQEEILSTCVAYAKADNPELEGDSIIQYAVGFGEMYLLTFEDFDGVNPDKIKPFDGDRPVWRKKRW